MFNKRSLISLLMLAAVVFVFTGCAEFLQGKKGMSKVPRYPDQVTPEAKVAFQGAEDLYLAGKNEEAKGLYSTFIDTYGYNELTDEARFKLGEISFTATKFEEALGFYQSAYAKLYNPKIAPKAQFKAALSLANLGRNDEAVKLLDKMNRPDMSAVLRIRGDSLNALTKAKLSYPLSDMISLYLFLLDDYADYTGDKAALKKIKEPLVTAEEAKANVKIWIDNKEITTASVERLPIKMMAGKTSGGYVYYKLGLLYFGTGDYKKAAKYLGMFVSGYSKSEYYSAALPIYEQVKAYEVKIGQYKIGVVLPLSGRYALFGQNALHGIECAAGLVPPCTSRVGVQLVTRDSKGSPEAAEQAVRELANQEGVVAIVGDMMSETVEEEARVAQELGIPMISLSQKAGVADIGDYIFRYAMDPESQVKALVDYAMQKRGITNFGVMYPQNSYGSNFLNLFKTVAESSGGKIVGEKSYSAEAAFTYVEAKPEARVVEATSEGGAPRPQAQPRPQGQRSGVIDGLITGHAVASTRDYTPERSSMSYRPPEYNLPQGDAVFIPDSYKSAGRLVSHLSDKGKLHGQLLMGTNRWDNPELATYGGSGVEGVVFVDGFFKESPDPTTRAFVQSFVQAFNIEPTILEAQAFDAAKMAIYAVKRGGSKRESVRNAIAKVKNFPGVTGSITVQKNGDAQRKLYILTVQGGRIVQMPEASRKSLNVARMKMIKSRSEAAAALKYEGYVDPNLATTSRKEVLVPETKYESPNE